MNDRNIPVTEDELHAYVDGELPAERRADVEAWLAAYPEDAERVQSWRAMAANNLKLPELKMVICGGSAMPRSMIKAFLDMKRPFASGSVK